MSRTITGTGVRDAPAARCLPPGPRDAPVIGSFRALQRDPLQYFLQLTRPYGEVARYNFLAWPTTLVNSPAGVKRILAVVEPLVALRPQYGLRMTLHAV